MSWGSTTSTTSPPSPPSPPAGPPRGMNFSRRQATAPSPPSPAFTWMRTSSTNFIGSPGERPAGPRNAKRRGARWPRGAGAIDPSSRLALGLGDDRDDALVAALAGELHRAVDLGVERVVAAHPDVLAGVELRAELADEDVAGEHLLRSV